MVVRYLIALSCLIASENVHGITHLIFQVNQLPLNVPCLSVTNPLMMKKIHTSLPCLEKKHNFTTDIFSVTIKKPSVKWQESN
jgi:hypothetical protein